MAMPGGSDTQAMPVSAPPLTAWACTARVCIDVSVVRASVAATRTLTEEALSQRLIQCACESLRRLGLVVAACIA